MKLKELEKYVQNKLTNDPAHDFSHIARVCNNAKKIAKHEKADINLVVAAALLHDIVQYPKSNPKSKTSSLESAMVAKKILPQFGFTRKQTKIVSDAIADHSYSRNKTPKNMVGKILQDADRLDAIGAIGIARAFTVGGAEKRSIYNVKDPFCVKRIPNDQLWTTDHFYRKLLLLQKKMHTNYAKQVAKSRTKFIKRFLDQLKKEVYS